MTAACVVRTSSILQINVLKMLLVCTKIQFMFHINAISAPSSPDFL